MGNVCDNTGYSVNGGFAEYVIASASFAARLPTKADFAKIAPILCAGVTTYKGLKETEARPGAVRGSIAGTRRDLDEAIAFGGGEGQAEITKALLEKINDIFERMKSGRIDGRMVLEFG